MDEDLLEDRPALSTGFDRQGAAVQPSRDRRRPDRLAPVPWHSPGRPLEFDLARLKLVANERAGTGLELEVVAGEGQIHAVKDASLGRPRAGPVARPGTSLSGDEIVEVDDLQGIR